MLFLLLTYVYLSTDHNSGTSTDTHPLFAMSGDNNDDVHIPLVFLFHKEGQALIEAWEEHAGLQVMLTDKIMVFGKMLLFIVCFNHGSYYGSMKITYTHNISLFSITSLFN